jgi:DNA-binding NarL/FixJ family response regulator
MSLGKEKPQATIRAVLVVENRLIHEALARLLQKQSDMSVVGQSSTSTAITRQVLLTVGDVLILDSLKALSLMDLGCDELEGRPRIKTLLFGMKEHPLEFLQAVQLGVRGYLLKDASSAEVVSAVRSVARGEAVCPAALCATLFEKVFRDSRRRSSVTDSEACLRAGLTFRQRELISLVAKGMSNKAIAETLKLSECTVKNHMYRIMKALEAGSRHEVVDLIRANAHLQRPA